MLLVRITVKVHSGKGFVDLRGPHLDMQNTEPSIKSLRSLKSLGDSGWCKATCKLLPRLGQSVHLCSSISAGGPIVPTHTANVPSSSTAAPTRTSPRRWALGGLGCAAAGRWTWQPWTRTPRWRWRWPAWCWCIFPAAPSRLRFPPELSGSAAAAARA